mmetsp:Transcript_20252/g.47615  ORF Transcript_20252/g.47615 Transcript_20252/m.47615 type:complete len:470 (-) Transcript_20252:1699-3108(-)
MSVAESNNNVKDNNEPVSLITSEKANSHSDQGRDLVNLKTIARVFARHLASKSLLTPFVLGILGDWGSGKSFFFDLIRTELTEIQKETTKDGEDKRQFVDSMYFIRFNAWTYSKNGVWASMMFRIFRGLSCQLELEQKIGELEEKEKKKTKISVIELYDDLSSIEQNYIEKLKEEEGPDFAEKLRKVKYDEDRASAPFADIFKQRMTQDEEELEQAQEELEKAATARVWEEAMEKTDARFSNALMDAVTKRLEHLKEENAKEYEKWVQVGFEPNFYELGPLTKLWAYMMYEPRFLLAATFLILVLVAATVYSEKKFNKGLHLFIYAFLALIASLPETWKRLTQPLEELSSVFSDEIGQITSFVLDIEKNETSNLLSKTAPHIERCKMRIINLRNRLKVREGESLQQVVDDRVHSRFYLKDLGILHQAQEDLTRLSEAMRAKYKRQNKEPRILLFVDDLDKCEPKGNRCS